MGLESALLLSLLCVLCAPMYERILRGSLPIQYWMATSIWLVYGLVLHGGVALSGVIFLLLVLVLWLPVYARSSRLQRWFSAAVPSGIGAGLSMGCAVLLLCTALFQARIIVGAPASVTMMGNLLEPAAFYALFGMMAAMGMHGVGFRKCAGMLGVLLAAAAAWTGGFLAVPTALIGMPSLFPVVPLQVPTEPLAWVALPVLLLSASVFYRPAISSAHESGSDGEKFCVHMSIQRRWDTIVCLFAILLCYPVLASIASLPSLVSCILLLTGVQSMQDVVHIWRAEIDGRCDRAAFFVGCICLPLSGSLMAGLSMMYIAYALTGLFGRTRQDAGRAVYVIALVSIVIWALVIP